jgi:hypothetical protein
MTSHRGLVLVLTAAGLSPLSARGEPPPQPAHPADTRILLRLELPAVRVIVKRGRTVVYEVPRADRPQPPAPQRPADNRSGRPAQAGPSAGMVRPDGEPGRPFSRAEVEALVKALRAGAGPAPLETKPVRDSWPDPTWGMARGPDSVTVWAGVFDYEVLFEFRLAGRGRALPNSGKASRDPLGIAAGSAKPDDMSSTGLS